MYLCAMGIEFASFYEFFFFIMAVGIIVTVWCFCGLTCVIFRCTQWSRTNCSLDCITLSISASSSSLVSWFIYMKGNLMGKSKSGNSRVTWTKSSSCTPLVTSVKTESNRFCRVFNMSGTFWTFNSLNVTLLVGVGVKSRHLLSLLLSNGVILIGVVDIHGSIL